MCFEHHSFYCEVNIEYFEEQLKLIIKNRKLKNRWVIQFLLKSSYMHLQFVPSFLSGCDQLHEIIIIINNIQIWNLIRISINIWWKLHLPFVVWNKNLWYLQSTMSLVPPPKVNHSDTNSLSGRTKTSCTVNKHLSSENTLWFL